MDEEEEVDKEEAEAKKECGVSEASMSGGGGDDVKSGDSLPDSLATSEEYEVVGSHRLLECTLSCIICPPKSS